MFVVYILDASSILGNILGLFITSTCMSQSKQLDH